MNTYIIQAGQVTPTQLPPEAAQAAINLTRPDTYTDASSRWQLMHDASAALIPKAFAFRLGKHIYFGPAVLTVAESEARPAVEFISPRQVAQAIINDNF